MPLLLKARTTAQVHILISLDARPNMLGNVFSLLLAIFEYFSSNIVPCAQGSG
jgi:hypothetical protein